MATIPRNGTDPTENVKALSEAANKRQDDLREANDKLHASEIKRLDAAFYHLKDMMTLHEGHARELREKEVVRLDSIRQVDVTAVRTEADRALAAIQTLAATTATNAETLRNALISTAATIAKSTSDTVSQITERIAALEKSSYEGVGKQRVADPQMELLYAEVKAMRGSRTEGVDKTWGIIVVVATLIIAGTVAFVSVNRSGPSAPGPVYQPSPSSGAAPPIVQAPATVVAPPGH